MALDPLQVTIALEKVICHAEGTDPGRTVEPYLWTVFFKIDGSTVTLGDADLTLTGTAVTVGTPGSHNNLGVAHMDTGDQVAVAQAIGRWTTKLTAIPVSAAIQTLGAPPFVPGAAGVAMVLMEFDWTTNATAEAGHQALNAAMRDELNRIVDGLGVLNQSPSQSDFDKVAKKVQEAVKTAIVKQGGILQDLLNLVNADDFIGADAVLFSHTELEATSPQPFSRRFTTQKVGDWEIKGKFTAARVPAHTIPRPVPANP